MIVGIDSGVAGGIGAIEPRMPEKTWSTRTPRLNGTKGDEDVPKMIEIIRALVNAGRGRMGALLGEFVGIDDGSMIFAIEAQTRGAGKSSWTSANVSGRVWGEWVGIIQTLRVPLVIVRPQDWQKEMLKGEKRKTYAERKSAARKIAAMMFPGVAPLMSIGANGGIADALLIAEFVRRTQGVPETRA